MDISSIIQVSNSLLAQEHHAVAAHVDGTIDIIKKHLDSPDLSPSDSSALAELLEKFDTHKRASRTKEFLGSSARNF